MTGGRAGEEEAAAADTELKTKTPHVNVGKNHASSLFVFEKSGQFMSVFHFSTFRLFGVYGFSGPALENPLLFDFWSFRVCPGSAKTEKYGAPPPTHPAEGGVIQTNQQH